MKCKNTKKNIRALQVLVAVRVHDRIFAPLSSKIETLHFVLIGR